MFSFFKCSLYFQTLFAFLQASQTPSNSPNPDRSLMKASLLTFDIEAASSVFYWIIGGIFGYTFVKNVKITSFDTSHTLLTCVPTFAPRKITNGLTASRSSAFSHLWKSVVDCRGSSQTNNRHSVIFHPWHKSQSLVLIRISDLRKGPT